MEQKQFIVVFGVVLIFSAVVTLSAFAEDWVHPAMRNQYAGYQKLEDRKQNSPDWRYATNRPQGNIHGGGTVEYKDYTPVSRVPSQKKQATYQRPLRTGAYRTNSCNCPNSSLSSQNDR